MRRAAAAPAGALAALIAATFCTSAFADTQIEPYLGVDVLWIDNLNLTSSDLPTVETYLLRARPGVRLTQDSRRMKTYLDYEAQALFYEYDSDSNTVFHQGDIGSDLEAVEDWFFVGLDGSYFQSVVDPALPINTNNIFNVENTADTAAAHVTPELRHEWRSARLDARYSVGFVNYYDTPSNQADLDDSRNQEGTFDLESTNEEAPVSWAARYRYEHVEYDIALPFEYERAEAELGFRLTQELRLIGRGGLESDPAEPIANGGLDESYWQAGFLYRHGPRAEVLLLVGERFFGTSYEALARLHGRVWRMEFSYDELPTTETQRAATRDVQAPDPTAPIPSRPAPPIGRTTSEVYLLKRMHGMVGAVGRYTHVGVELTSENREYVRLGGIEDKFRIGRLFLSRQFGQRTSGELSGEVIDSELRDGASYTDGVYGLRLMRELSPRTLLTFFANHQRRHGDASVIDYDSTWIGLGLQVTFF